jgi:hypothetical protein
MSHGEAMKQWVSKRPFCRIDARHATARDEYDTEGLDDMPAHLIGE